MHQARIGSIDIMYWKHEQKKTVITQWVKGREREEKEDGGGRAMYALWPNFPQGMLT